MRIEIDEREPNVFVIERFRTDKDELPDINALVRFEPDDGWVFELYDVTEEDDPEPRAFEVTHSQLVDTKGNSIPDWVMIVERMRNYR